MVSEVSDHNCLPVASVEGLSVMVGVCGGAKQFMSLHRGHETKGKGRRGLGLNICLKDLHLMIELIAIYFQLLVFPLLTP